MTTDTKSQIAWPDNEWPEWPTADGQPTTGAKSYGGIVGQITPPPDTLPDDDDDPPGPSPDPNDEQPDTGEPRQEFPADDEDTPPEVIAQSPNAGQPQGEDRGPEHQTGY
jgi:hypothetical protein